MITAELKAYYDKYWHDRSVRAINLAYASICGSVNDIVSTDDVTSADGFYSITDASGVARQLKLLPSEFGKIDPMYGDPMYGVSPTSAGDEALVRLYPPGGVRSIAWDAPVSTPQPAQDPKAILDAKEEELRKKVIPEFKGEDTCDYRFRKYLLGAPEPAAQLENSEREQKQVRQWFMRSTREWPRCRKGGEINLAFEEFSDSKRGFVIRGYLRCSLCGC